MALCRRTLGDDRHRYTLARPGKLGADPIDDMDDMDDMDDGWPYHHREEGEESLSNGPIQRLGAEM